MAQVALAWVLKNPVVSAPIVGPTKAHHLSDAVAALDVQVAATRCASWKSRTCRIFRANSEGVDNCPIQASQDRLCARTERLTLRRPLMPCFWRVPPGDCRWGLS